MGRCKAKVIELSRYRGRGGREPKLIAAERAVEPVWIGTFALDFSHHVILYRVVKTSATLEVAQAPAPRQIGDLDRYEQALHAQGWNIYRPAISGETSIRDEPWTPEPMFSSFYPVLEMYNLHSDDEAGVELHLDNGNYTLQALFHFGWAAKIIFVTLAFARLAAAKHGERRFPRPPPMPNNAA